MINNFPKHIDETEKLVKEFYEVHLLKPKIKDNFVMYTISKMTFLGIRKIKPLFK